MNILATLRNKEKTLLQDLDTVRAALKLLGGESTSKAVGTKRRKMSAATRKKMAAAAKARWAKVKKSE
jgi:hypothetical protein